jgi:hypothetical protein
LHLLMDHQEMYRNLYFADSYIIPYLVFIVINETDDQKKCPLPGISCLDLIT